MPAIRIPSQQRFVLDNVTWKRYTRLLREFEDRHLRMTYDRGMLEIMTPSYEHEISATFIGRLVVTLTEELNLPVRDGRSTTLRRRRKQKGLEPDNCYWIAHEADVRNNTALDLRKDPPPDLAIEVDISRSSFNRMGIYANLRVPEVWRYAAQGLSFLTLTVSGEYAVAAVSTLFPLSIAPADLMPFIQMRGTMDDNAIFRQFRTWIQSKVAAASTPQ